MRKITKYPKLVVAEATNLRKFATKEEKGNLISEFLNPDSPTRCIYGLLTGDCYSNRAEQLIVKCAPRVYHINLSSDVPCSAPRHSNKLNGKPKLGNRSFFWSPIEKFIQLAPSEMNEKLIDFIKGTIKKLE